MLLLKMEQIQRNLKQKLIPSESKDSQRGNEIPTHNNKATSSKNWISVLN
jgi:hypothetical protein